MKVDMTSPWKEDTPKKPKLGEVLEAIIDVQNDSTEDQNELNEHLTEIEVDVNKQLAESKARVAAATAAHVAKKGPAHGETKSTIGLSKKENLPAASIDDIKNGLYKREWVTPRTASLILEQSLKASSDEYMKSGMLPLSSGRLLGRILTNQIYRTGSGTIPERTPAGQVSYLLSTEEDYVMFAELGQGRVTDFSEGGDKAPVGVTRITIREGNIYTGKGQPISLNNITTSGKFIQKVTGLEWGFGEEHGNFYDSNFYPSFVVESTETGTETQEVEASLFDPTMVYKPDGTVYIRNMNTTKHNFNELYVNQNGRYPFNNSVYLSSDNFMTHLANTQLIQQDGIWGILFDFMSGDVGIADWYPDAITKSSDKVMSKQGYYNLRQTTVSGITGFDNGKSYIRLPKDLPWGVENRENFNNSNFADGVRYASVFLPINDIISGFNNLSAANQQKVIDNIDQDLLVRICMAWDNEYTKAGVMRIPFYYVVPGTEKSWSTYIDIKFAFTIGADYNTVAFSAFNFNKTNRPVIGTNLDLTNTTGNRFYQWSTDLKENPFHPKVFKGCFLETGGHITAYIIGHRQYICYYKHDITSVRNWILQDMVPSMNEEKNRIQDVGMLPANRFYSDNTRLVPLLFDEGKITYLSRMRNKHGRYDYGVFSVNGDTFDLLSSRSSESSDITWLERKTNKNYPILVDNSNLRSPGINTTGLVFSEVNGYIGYQDHGFTGTAFLPSGPTEIDASLKQRIILNAGITEPYPIFFYYEEVLYWVIASRNGTKNKNGFDVNAGGIRVDVLYDGKSYTIRPLPGMEMVSTSGVLFEDYPDDLIQGRESESFDDVYIVNKTGTDASSTVFVNYPDLDGRYYSFEIEADDAGYKYPKTLNPPVLNLKEESGYGTYCPYVLYGSYFTPFMMSDKLYLPDKDIFKLTRYDINGQTTLRNYYMGWENEQPIYVVGENITVNGQSLLLDRGINIPITGHNHSGKVFISYYNETFNVYSTNENTLGYPTEPDNAILFAGFWEKVGEDYVLNFHAPRGYSDISSQDFINSLLPIVDGKQMATDSMGSTFPAVLGKLSGTPRQYYFRK